MEDWYGISRIQVVQHGGVSIFRYCSSLEQLLRGAFPEYQWIDSRFQEKGKKRNGYWQEKQNLLPMLNQAEGLLGINQVCAPFSATSAKRFKKPDDWNTITLSDLKGVGFPPTLRKSQLVELLQEKYPGHTWDPLMLMRGRYAQQRRLENAVASLFEVPTQPLSHPTTTTTHSLSNANSPRVTKSKSTCAKKQTFPTPRLARVSRWIS